MSLTLDRPIVENTPSIDLTDFEQEFAIYSPPEILSGESRDEAQAEWVIAGVVIAAAALVVGVALSIAIFVCSVCVARSFNACVYDLRHYWGRGCGPS
jgi:hypothetical protein